MAHAMDITRIVCGIVVFACGLLGLGIFGWEPPVAGSEARPFQLAMQDAGYFLPLMTGIFLITGASFVTNVFSALSAVVLFPVSLNILLFHTVLGAGQAPIAIAFFMINSFLLWYHREAYAPLLRARF